jgi:acyl carrier protein
MTDTRIDQTNPVPTNKTSDDTIRCELHSFIRETFLQLRPKLQVGDNDDPAETGLLDSLAFVEVISFIQRRYGVVVRDVDITPENFSSVAAITRYLVERSST